MSKFPSEIFGYYYKNMTKDAMLARRKHWCPFHDTKCYKKSRLVNLPFGVCTAHVEGKEIALCPRRFLEKGIVFQDIAQAHFGSIDNIIVFSETLCRIPRGLPRG